MGGEPLPFQGSRGLKPEEQCDLRSDWVVGIGAVIVNNYEEMSRSRRGG